MTTLNVSGVADISPYTSFGAGWSVVNDSFKVVGGALRSVGFTRATALATSPPTTGSLKIEITVAGNSGMFSDFQSIVFSTSAGNGYILDIDSSNIYFRNLTAFSGSNSLAGASGLTYTSGQKFWAEFVINGTSSSINIYQGALGVTTSLLLTVSSLTYAAGMAAGFSTFWGNSNLAGVVAANAYPSSATIDSINSGSSILVGSSGNTVTTTGLGTLTSLTIGGTAVSSLSAPSGDGTFSIPMWADGVIGFALGAPQAVVTGDGTNTASSTTTITAPTNYTAVTLTSVNTASGYLGNQVSLSVSDVIIYPTAASLGTSTNSIGVDGVINTSYAGSQTLYKRNNTTGVVTQITLINGIVAPSNLALLWLMGI